MARQVETDELRHRAEVFLEPPETWAELLARGSAVAGADRIDEDQVRDVEERVRIVLEGVGRRRRVAIGHEPHALRSPGAQMQPHGRRARAAIEDEADRTRRSI